MRHLLVVSVHVLLLGLAVGATSRSMGPAPPPVAPGKTDAKAPAPTPKRPAGRTAASGGNAQQATGQGAKNGIGRFGYMPSEDPASSIYKSIGRRRALLEPPVPAAKQQPATTTPKKPGPTPRAAKKPQNGQAAGKPAGQGARSAVDAIGSERPIQQSKP